VGEVGDAGEVVVEMVGAAGVGLVNILAVSGNERV